jgi:hypothetical protein
VDRFRSITFKLPGLAQRRRYLLQGPTPYHEHDAQASQADGTDADGLISFVARATGADQTVCGSQITIQQRR